MKYSKLICTSNKNLKRVHTKHDSNRPGLYDPASAVEIVKRTTKKKDDKIILIYEFEDGKRVRVTYEDLE